MENTYEGTYDLRDSSKIHLRDHPSSMYTKKDILENL